MLGLHQCLAAPMQDGCTNARNAGVQCWGCISAWMQCWCAVPGCTSVALHQCLGATLGCNAGVTSQGSLPGCSAVPGCTDVWIESRGAMLRWHPCLDVLPWRELLEHHARMHPCLSAMLRCSAGAALVCECADGWTQCLGAPTAGHNGDNTRDTPVLGCDVHQSPTRLHTAPLFSLPSQAGLHAEGTTASPATSWVTGTVSPKHPHCQSVPMGKASLCDAEAACGGWLLGTALLRRWGHSC